MGTVILIPGVVELSQTIEPCFVSDACLSEGLQCSLQRSRSSAVNWRSSRVTAISSIMSSIDSCSSREGFNHLRMRSQIFPSNGKQRDCAWSENLSMVEVLPCKNAISDSVKGSVLENLPSTIHVPPWEKFDFISTGSQTLPEQDSSDCV